VTEAYFEDVMESSVEGYMVFIVVGDFTHGIEDELLGSREVLDVGGKGTGFMTVFGSERCTNVGSNSACVVKLLFLVED
jgi:hypothetical protein